MSNTMREILFRGKRVDNGEWVQGVPCGGYMILGFDNVYGDDEVARSYYPEFDYVEIDPLTLGECTGLTDKNGVKIFEGDIVKHRVMYSEGKAIKFEDQIFTVRYSVEQARFLAYLSNGVFNPVAMQDCEVIGNIHDNELLEESNA